jgi:hypothetical protein
MVLNKWSTLNILASIVIVGCHSLLLPISGSILQVKINMTHLPITTLEPGPKLTGFFERFKHLSKAAMDQVPAIRCKVKFIFFSLLYLEGYN